MSIAGIEKVREAEIQAAQIRKESEEAASQIIADGKREAKMLFKRLTERAMKLIELQCRQLRPRLKRSIRKG